MIFVTRVVDCVRFDIGFDYLFEIPAKTDERNQTIRTMIDEV